MFCVEIDEEQYRKHIKQDETNRYDDLFMDFSGRYICIRYNPDKFKDKYNKSKIPFFDTSMVVLGRCIDTHMHRINNNKNVDLAEIHHVFYDEV